MIALKCPTHPLKYGGRSILDRPFLTRYGKIRGHIGYATSIVTIARHFDYTHRKSIGCPSEIFFSAPRSEQVALASSLLNIAPGFILLRISCC